MAKIYKVTSYILDLNGNCPTKEDVKNQILNNRYPEFIMVEEILEADCGEWSDDHELNKRGCDYSKYFNDIK